MMRWDVDPTGYPLIYIEPIQSWLQALPVTKAQFEFFLAESKGYTDEWYALLLEFNPRMSYRNINAKLYEQLFMTGLREKEFRAFVRWFNGHRRGTFSIPAATQWRAAYQWLSDLNPLNEMPIQNLDISAQLIWENLCRQRSEGTLASQLLLKDGVLEWVCNEEETLVGGLGKTRATFSGIIREPTEQASQPARAALQQQDDERWRREALTPFGIRLLRSDS